MGCGCRGKNKAAKAGRGISEPCTGPNCAKKLATQAVKGPEQTNGVAVSANNKKGIVQ